MAVVLHRRRPEVRALSVVTVLCLALVFVPAVVSLADKLPLLGQVALIRAEMPMALAFAVLAGYGINLVVKADAGDSARWLGVTFGIASVALAVLWLFGRGPLNPVDASVRAHSFIWPAVEAVAGLAAAGFLLWVDRHRRAAPVGPRDPLGAGSTSQGIIQRSGMIAGVGLLAVQTAFLVSAGAQMMESSPHSFPQTPTTRAFAAAVGSATVANGSFGGCRLGIGPNDNDTYGVRELGVYDPIIPKQYFAAWTADTQSASGVPELYVFCPAVTTVGVAREFGVGYVLELAGQPGPTGSVFVRHLGDEDLYRIPGSGEATVAPLSAGVVPGDDVVGTPVTVHHPSPSQWRLKTSSPVPQAVRFHLTDVPGWQATIDGRPLALEPYAGMMLQARIPAGVHSIVLRYWPQTFTVGILLALASAGFLLALLVVASVRKRRTSVVDEPARSAPGVPGS